MKSFSHTHKGFSLIELLITTSILMLIYIVFTSFQKDVWTYNVSLSNTLVAQQEAKQSLATMIKEIRTASASSNGAYPISETATSSITFYSDINADGLKDQVRYYLATSTLKKQVVRATGNPVVYLQANASTSELIHNIYNGTSTPIFTYYSSSYDGSTAPLSSPIDVSMVRLVKITVVIERDPNRNPLPMTLVSQVSIRNLKDNL